MSAMDADAEDESDSCRPTSGQVVPFQKPASVEYDGEAQRMVAQLADLVLKLSVLTRRAPSGKLKDDALDILDRMSDRMDVVDEHIGVLEMHADMILECMSEDENAYFINDSKNSALTVTSLIKKRCRTVRLQKVVVGKSGQELPVAQDNDDQQLTDCDGSLACRLDTRNRRVRSRV